MPTITVKTQQEWNALPASFGEFTTVEIHSADWITIKKCPESSSVEAWESSRVVARESSRVVARESSRVEAWESSRVEAWGSSRVVARESSSVEAWESSSVVARESSSVVARGSSRVEAWESSSVVARGSSSVVARGEVAVHVQSDSSSVLLFSLAVAWLYGKSKATIKQKTARVIRVKEPTKRTAKTWLNSEGIATESFSVILFKRVSAGFKTQEGSPNETLWTVGETVVHKGWEPDQEECGQGKFHACSRPYFCDEFRSESGDKYIAIQIALKDLFVWPKKPSYPHKVAFRKGTVLYECDRFGDKIP